MSNFRRKYICFHAKKSNATEATQVEGNMLINRFCIKQSEIDLLDTLKVRCDFKNMYKNVLQNSSNIWKALA